MSRNQHLRRQLGVTLVETLLTLSIAGIVLGAGVPSFGLIFPL